MGLPDLLWTGWIMGWWTTPPRVFGPPGTTEMLARLEQAFGYDIAVRNSMDRLPQPWQSPTVSEFEGGMQVEADDFRAVPFRVDHSPVDQAFGLRVETEKGSVAFSGDTSAIEALAEAANGVDLLVHEVYNSKWARDRLASLREHFGEASLQFRASQGIFRYHTGSEELGPIARLSDSPRLILNHVLGPPDASAIAQDIARDYDGTITVGEDLQSFTV